MSVTEPRSRCLTPEEATPFYDRLGSGQDWQRLYESFAIGELIGHAAYRPGAVEFEFVCGTATFLSPIARISTRRRTLCAARHRHHTGLTGAAASEALAGTGACLPITFLGLSLLVFLPS